MPSYIEKEKPPSVNSKLLRFFGWLGLLLVICIVCVLCASCAGDPPPETGHVINRKYEPEHWEAGYDTYYETEYVCGYDDVYDYNSGEYKYKYDCDFEDVEKRRYEEHHRWVEDEWSLLLRKCEQKDNGDEKCREGWRDITEDEYSRHDVGDYYPKKKEE